MPIGRLELLIDDLMPRRGTRVVWCDDGDGSALVWKGACKGGMPDGPSEAQSFEHGRPIDRFIGTYRNGKREGEGHYVWNETMRFDGRYAGNMPQRPGALKIDGDTFAGVWQAGCLTGEDRRLVAFAAPRTSCARSGANRLRLDLSMVEPPPALSG